MGFERGISFVELQGTEWSRLTWECASLSVRAHNSTPSKSSQPSSPSRSSYPFTSSSFLELSLLHYLVDAAGGEPDWSWAAVWRPHRGPPGGPCEGGCPRGWPGPSRAPARTPPISEEPLRGASGWGNRLLMVINDEVAVTEQTRALFKGGGVQPKSRRSGMVCLRGDAAWTT